MSQINITENNIEVTVVVNEIEPSINVTTSETIETVTVEVYEYQKNVDGGTI